eukprot:6187409-Pleurochrysis_carterae.AAC.5
MDTSVRLNTRIAQSISYPIKNTTVVSKNNGQRRCNKKAKLVGRPSTQRSAGKILQCHSGILCTLTPPRLTCGRKRYKLCVHLKRSTSQAKIMKRASLKVQQINCCQFWRPKSLFMLQVKPTCQGNQSTNEARYRNVHFSCFIYRLDSG